MPRIVDRRSYNGADARIERLGLRKLWAELETILSSFTLLVKEARDANGGAAVREMIDAAFQNQSGWFCRPSGGVDWTKCATINGTRVCVGVEVQVSGRSDLLIVDVDHLRQQITSGHIDIGVLVVPTDRLSVFLTDRGPSFTDATNAIERGRAQDLPLIVLGLAHDGSGPPLAKRRTRQGRKRIRGKPK